MTAPLLDIQNLGAGLGDRRVLHEISAAFANGELIALIGPNGAGKTTLLRAIAGLIPASGAVAIAGTPVPNMTRGERARTIGYLPQGHQTHWPLPVRDIVALGRFPHGATDPRRLGREDLDIVTDAMRRAGVTDFADRPAPLLSGGEKARVALARVLAQQTRILLADEPTASLDPRYQLDIMALLKEVSASGTLVIAVMHDLALAARFADRVWVLDRGRAAAPAPVAEALSDQVLADVFRIRAAPAPTPHGATPAWEGLP